MLVPIWLRLMNTLGTPIFNFKIVPGIRGRPRVIFPYQRPEAAPDGSEWIEEVSGLQPTRKPNRCLLQ
jgi:hypothetical protein